MSGVVVVSFFGGWFFHLLLTKRTLRKGWEHEYMCESPDSERTGQ